MAGLVSLVLALAVVPALVLGDYCGYIRQKDCYHIADINKVCGTDGNTYRNQCLLGKAYCQDSTIGKASDGACKAGTSIGTTPDPVHGSEVVLDILCLDISYFTCQSTGPAVCGSDGVRYTNMCEFDKAKCSHRQIQPNATCT